MHLNEALKALALCGVVSAFKADIRADTNRDGIVDVAGCTDVDSKANWTDERGALLLANIGDTDRRCSKQLLRHPPASNEELEACNDAADDIQRSPQYLASLRTVPIVDLKDTAMGRISVPDAQERAKVRIFHRDATSWKLVRDNDTFSANQLQKGLDLGIDAKDTRRPNGWDGRVTVQFEVKDHAAGDDSQTSTDTVMLRVSPLLTHHHLQGVQQVLTTAGNETLSPYQLQFNKDLEKIAQELRIPDGVFQFNGSDDHWTQDYVEPAYMSIPGPNGTVVSIRIHIRSGQDDRVAGRQIFEYLRNTGVGAVQHLGGAYENQNEMGNLETIPPYELNGKRFPAGRVIQGSHGTKIPHSVEFLQAQGMQDPVILDSDWLFIGHVDEFVQFLPAQSQRGWLMTVADAQGGLNVLREAQAAGYGQVGLFSRKNDTATPTSPIEDAQTPTPVPDITIDQFLSEEHIHTTADEITKRMKANIAPDEANLTTFMRKGGCRCRKRRRPAHEHAEGPTDNLVLHIMIASAAVIYRLPCYRLSVTYLEEGNWAPGLGDHLDTGHLKASGMIPGVINGVVLSNSTYLAPNPWGPMIDGKDIFAEAVKAQYAKANYTVQWIDDWNTHHNFDGEVHCGTNTVRDATWRWW